MKRAALYALSCLASLSLASAALAGAWTKPEGKGEVIVTSLYFSSGGFWDNGAHHSAQPRFEKIELNPYLEYGYSDEITLGGNLFLHALSQDSRAGSTAAEHNFGLGNSEFFARYQLYQSPQSVVSLQPLISLPSAYEQSAAPRSGSDSFDGELSLLGGHNFALFGQSHYGEARIGYRHRLDSDLHDQLRIDAKLGLRLNENWEMIPAAYGVFALASAPNPTFTEDGQQDYDLVKLEAMLRYNLSEQSYLQGGGFAHLYGRNVGDGSGFMLSFGRHF